MSRKKNNRLVPDRSDRDQQSPPVQARKRIFLLSPASVSGIRAGYLLREDAKSEMACRLREDGVSLGELFTFLSSLYFRGKLAYARAFAIVPPNVEGAFVITASGGLLPPHTLMTLERLREISASDLDPSDPHYRKPLDRDAQMLATNAADCDVVLLGSIATPKYVEPLLKIFGRRLLFPAEFVGRGDMSRGGLLLRCVQSGIPLTHIPPARCHAARIKAREAPAITAELKNFDPNMMLKR